MKRLNLKLHTYFVSLFGYLTEMLLTSGGKHAHFHCVLKYGDHAVSQYVRSPETRTNIRKKKKNITKIITLIISNNILYLFSMLA